MAIPEYSKARRLAQKAYRQDMEARRNPYLQVLDEILPLWETVGETDLGLVEIPISQIAGTKTAGRTRAFAGNFMPLLPEASEFADKWSSLYLSHLEEGIREPVIACEFLNCYYVIEGNKRVSVMKYSGAVSLPGYVTASFPRQGIPRSLRFIMNIWISTGPPGEYHLFLQGRKLLPALPAAGKGSPDALGRGRSALLFLRFSALYRDLRGKRRRAPPSDGRRRLSSLSGRLRLGRNAGEIHGEAAAGNHPALAGSGGSGLRRVCTPDHPARKRGSKHRENPAQKTDSVSPPPRDRGFLHHGTIYTSAGPTPTIWAASTWRTAWAGQVTTRVYDGLKNGRTAFLPSSRLSWTAAR